ncbi:hypothetical protein niasHT_007699 [Heterodera trifolii]|uniref:Uncharacterized protein n=1 Tax=Heterodera trifolii TaxID=157864 RepID=A0ABD2MA90_9BILA
MDVVYAIVEGAQLFIPFFAVFVLLTVLYHYNKSGRLLDGENHRIVGGEADKREDRRSDEEEEEEEGEEEGGDEEDEEEKDGTTEDYYYGANNGRKQRRQNDKEK